MAQITVSDLRPADSGLFTDSESYLQNLTDTELDTTQGGMCMLLLGLAMYLLDRCFGG